MNTLSIVQMVLLFLLSIAAAIGMGYVLYRFFGQLTAIERARWGEKAEPGSEVFKKAFGRLLTAAKRRRETADAGQQPTDDGS